MHVSLQVCTIWVYQLGWLNLWNIIDLACYVMQVCMPDWVHDFKFVRLLTWISSESHPKDGTRELGALHGIKYHEARVSLTLGVNHIVSYEVLNPEGFFTHVLYKA